MSQKKQTQIKIAKQTQSATPPEVIHGKAIRIGPNLMEDLRRARNIVVAKAADSGKNAWLNAPMRAILSRPGWEPVIIQLVLDDWSNTLG